MSGVARRLEIVDGQVGLKVRPGFVGEVVTEMASSIQLVKEETVRRVEVCCQPEVEGSFQVSKVPCLPRQPVRRQSSVSSYP